MNLKYNYPIIVFVLAFVTAIYFSFKHERPPVNNDGIAASAQERQDQITLSAMHAEPAAPATVPQPNILAETASIINASAADLAQMRVLDQVLAAKNDNDPRLDKELRGLSPSAKALMRGRYASTAPEKRNQRGTMVYLMGRELNSNEDVAFLHSVLSESPCLSLTNCGVSDNASMASGDHAHDGLNEVTLSYPQLVALKSIESWLAQPGTTELTPQLLAELEAARHSPIRKVAVMAEDISRQYHSRHP